MGESKALETVGLIATLWILAAIVGHKLTPKLRRKKTQRLCGYHIASTMRIGQVALLDSPRCELCAEERH